MKGNKSKGFTIVELIIVMAVIAILILIAAPTVIKYIEYANKTAQFGTANTIYRSAISALAVFKITHPNHMYMWVNGDMLTVNINQGVDGDTNETKMRYYNAGYAEMSFGNSPIEDWGAFCYYDKRAQMLQI